VSAGRSLNHGVRKVCGCSKQKWPKCSHSWYFNFKPRSGPPYRFSLDRHFGRHIATKAEAVAEADSIRAAIREGRFHVGAPESGQLADAMTVSQLVKVYQEAYIDVRLTRSAKAEANRLAIAMRTLITRRNGGAVQFGAIPVADLTARDVATLQASRLGCKRKHCRCDSWDTCQHPWRESAAAGGVAANRAIARLRACFNWALKQEIVRKTPFRVDAVAAVSLLPETTRFRRLEGDEEARLLAECSLHMRSMVTAALETCCRVSELLSLQWAQVSFARSELYLPARKTKARRDRFLPISERLKAVLEMRRTDPAGRDLPADAYVFGTPTGERIASIKTAWRLTCGRARISGLHFHDLRREAACRWLETGRFYLHDVQRFLDHADIATTSRYLQASRLSLHNAMRQVEADRRAPQPNPTGPAVQSEDRLIEQEVPPNHQIN
jgi:integrase